MIHKHSCCPWLQTDSNDTLKMSEAVNTRICTHDHMGKRD